MGIFTKALNWVMVLDHLIPIICAVVAILIGLFVEHKKRHRKMLDERQVKSELGFRRMVEDVKGASPEDIAKVLNLREQKTINIYWSPKYHIDLHRTMILEIVKHLQKEGFKFKMSMEDQLAMQDWSVPVLCIYPLGNSYFFHNNQLEERTNTYSFEVSGNDINAINSELDSSILMMRGVPSE